MINSGEGRSIELIRKCKEKSKVLLVIDMLAGFSLHRN